MSPSQTTQPDNIETVLAEVRKELLDLGLRNPLLNYRLLKSRGLEVVDEHPVEVYRMLVSEAIAFSFLPSDDGRQNAVGSDSEEDEGLNFAADPDEDGESRYTDRYLQTAIELKTLQRRLLATYYSAMSSIEEQGVNTLFLGLGMMRWREDENSSDFHRAPLLLVPVELVRSNARERFHLRYTGEEIGANICLAELLKQEFGLRYPELSDSDDLDVPGYLRTIQKAVESQRAWSVDPDAIILGFFSFAKFLMYRDLDPATWPSKTALTDHPLAIALLGSGTLAGDPSPYGENESVDEVSAAEAFHVVDADSSQALALLDAAGSRNLVIQGPPGTGKSQTIVNLIAGAIASGKRVLFVSEKMAALSVVKRRLDSVGLGAACLELHSNKTSKKTLIEELKRTRQIECPGLQRSPSDVAALQDARKRLNNYCDAVNARVGRTSETPCTLYARLLGAQERLGSLDPPELSLPNATAWDDVEAARNRSLVQTLNERLSRCGIPKQHPFWGTGLRVFLPTQHSGIRQILLRAAEALNELDRCSANLAADLGTRRPETRKEVAAMHAACLRLLEAPPTDGLDLRLPEWSSETERIRAILNAGERHAAIHSEWDCQLRPDAWQKAGLAALGMELEQTGRRWWHILSARWRSARSKVAACVLGPVPKSNSALLRVVAAIEESSQLESTLRSAAGFITNLFRNGWKQEHSDWSVLKRQFEWIVSTATDVNLGVLPGWCLDPAPRAAISGRVKNKSEVLASALNNERLAVQAIASALQWEGNSAGQLDTELNSDIRARWERMASRVADLEALVAYNRTAEECRSCGLGAVADIADTWDVAAVHLGTLFDRVCAARLVEFAFHERPVLAEFDGVLHQQTVDQFCRLDRRHIEGTRALVAQEHARRLPASKTTSGQIGILLHEFEKKGRFIPIRKLMERAGNAIQAIKPVFMMSPPSIANFLPPGAVDFDVVVFDEASQVRPADSLGAIVRGRQAVVVGDSKQLPPTSFFDAMVSSESDGEDDELPTADIESILGLFCSRGAHQRMLRWHYRSRHESLIAVSNHLFYDDRLLVFPSPDQERREFGLIYHRIENAYWDRGRTRTNPTEAKVVAEAVMAHARRELRKPSEKRLTLGVAAFSVAQMDAILAEVELLRRANPSCEEFFSCHPYEPFFVKNLETVQGDERDVIFISIGYGRTAEGYLGTSFGPLNRTGGERRLNVLITRARCRCEVFTGLGPEDIDLSGTRATGAHALKAFLTYAATGRLEVPAQTGREVDSAFEQQVLGALARSGYIVHAQVGCAGFFIDLAVVDPDRPGRYLVGIECDGASYHSARSARDRDRLRQAVLEGLNWRIHRIWSTDWFRNPQRELQKTIAAIEGAKEAAIRPASQPENGSRSMGANPVMRLSPAGPNVIPIALRPPPASVPKYQLAQIQVILRSDLHLIDAGDVARWLSEVVAVESPVHWLEAARRVANAAGVQRLGNRIQDAFKRGCRSGCYSGRFAMRDNFLWKADHKETAVRDRSDFPPAMKRIEYVAPEEIAAAFERVVRASYGIGMDEVTSSTCRLLGFARVTEEMRAVVEKQRDLLVSSGRLALKGGLLVCAVGSDSRTQPGV
jgi:very-short-patch-repair endonuclease